MDESMEKINLVWLQTNYLPNRFES